MQIVKITTASIANAAQVTPEMISELVTKLNLTVKPKKGEEVATAQRNAVIKALSGDNDYGNLAEGFDFEFETLPDLDIGNAGANKRGTRKTNKFSGAYKLTDKGLATLKAVEQSDPGRWEIVQHIVKSTSFEEFAKAAPVKAVKKVGAMTTAASEMAYSVRSGWVTPVAQEQAAQ